MNKIVTLDEMFPIISEQLLCGGSASFVINGTSMEPFLHNGKSEVRLVLPKHPLKKYDIILYRSKGQHFLLHRIVGRGENGYICRGDNQTFNEYPISEDAVIGVVTQVKRKGEFKDVHSLPYGLYSFFRVNTYLLLKAKRKAFAFIKQIIKKDEK